MFKDYLNTINEDMSNNIISFNKFEEIYKKLKKIMSIYPFEDYIKIIIYLIKFDIDIQDDNQNILFLEYKNNLEKYIEAYFINMNDKIFEHSISLSEYKNYVDNLLIAIDKKIDFINISECLNSLKYANVKENNTLEFFNYYRKLNNIVITNEKKR